jgi:hypothetical protein
MASPSALKVPDRFSLSVNSPYSSAIIVTLTEGLVVQTGGSFLFGLPHCRFRQ